MTKQVIIMRGVPGSGKSTRARELAQQAVGERDRCVICSADAWAEDREFGTPVLAATLSNLDMLPMSQRDATLAATLIQWLGTKVGFCFLESALGRCGYKSVREDRK